MTTLVSLRLGTSELTHDEVLRMIPESRIDASWRSGDLDFRGRVRASFGINVSVAEDETFGDAQAEAVRVVLALPNLFRRLGELKVAGELDFGIESESQALERSATLTPEAMAVFSRAGLSVRVSFYSAEDDDDED